MKIVITDSGLGGLNILYNCFKYFQEHNSNSFVELVFFNALPTETTGYNQINSYANKVRTFDSALNAMSKLNPDMILIACNTLSVVYLDTQFKKENKVRVVGIVEAAVDSIYHKLSENTVDNSKSKVVLIGTPTTINSGIYKNQLIERGIASDRILQSECPKLESIISENPNDDYIQDKLDEFIGHLFADENIISKNDKIYLALCCTHYEFAKIQFKLFLDSFKKNYELINPNEEMIKYINLDKSVIPVSFKELPINDTYLSRNNPTKINISIVSQTKIPINNINSLVGIFKQKCPELTESLINYQYQPEMFFVYQ